MADTDTEIVIGITLDDGTIKRAVIQADDLADKLGSRLGSGVSKGIDSSFTGLAVQFTAVLNVASKVANVLGGVFSKAIEEASGAEAALSGFNAALANMGNFSEKATADFQAFASQLQRVGTVSDDAVIGAATSLVSIGNLSGEALKQATQASVDLSAGLGVGLESSFDLVAKAAAGNTAALGRYGIKVDESIPKGERFAAVLAQINGRFAGLDENKANTFGGALTQLSNNFNDVFENLGKIVTGSPAVVAVIKFISEAFRKLAESIGAFGDKGDAFAPIIKGSIAFAQVLTQYVLPIVETLGNLSKAVFNAMLTGIQTIATGFSGAFSLIAQGLEALGVVSTATSASFQNDFAINKQVLFDVATATGEAAAKIGTDFSITAGVDTFLLDLQRAVDQAPPIMQKLQNSVKTAATGMSDELRKAVEQIMNLVKNGLVNAVSQGVQVLVTNLAKGRGAFEGFLSTVLGIFGDLLIQLGTAAIATGLGIEAIRASIVGLAGGPALAAGIALIALGAALKAFTGGSSPDSAQAVTPTGPGGVAGSPDLGGNNSQPVPERDSKTEVNINIQGNVLDRKESGLEIAQVLQEFFDTNDGVLARA